MEAPLDCVNTIEGNCELVRPSCGTHLSWRYRIANLGFSVRSDLRNKLAGELTAIFLLGGWGRHHSLLGGAFCISTRSGRRFRALRPLVADVGRVFRSGDSDIRNPGSLVSVKYPNKVRGISYLGFR